MNMNPNEVCEPVNVDANLQVQEHERENEYEHEHEHEREHEREHELDQNNLGGAFNHYFFGGFCNV